ncbi:MAG: hypothetical protein RL662_2042 [Bacteroidota bacterium]|jgi:copper chaperone CopZ
MKTKIFLLIAILFTTFNVCAQDKKAKKKNKEEVVFDVSMTCGKCKKKIEKNIAFEKGVTDLKVDLPSKTVMLEYNSSKTSVENLRKAFEELGYEANVHPQELIKE